MTVKKADSNYLTAVHYQFSTSSNIACFNGSYHVKRSTDKKDVKSGLDLCEDDSIAHRSVKLPTPIDFRNPTL